MTRHYCFVLLGCLLFPTLLSATSRVDSLKHVFQTLSQSEEKQGLLAFKIAEQYRNTRYLDSAISYADLGLELSEAGGVDRKMMYYDLVGQIHFRMGSYLLASRFFNKGEQLAIEAKDEKEMALFANSAGISYATFGDYQRALASFQKSHAYFLSKGLKKQTLATKKNIANLHGQLSRTEKAIGMLEEVYTESIEGNYKRMACKALIIQSEFYEGLIQMPKAIQQLEKALSIAMENDFREKVSCFESLGRIYGNLGDFEKADSLLYAGLELAEKSGGKSYISSMYVSLGDKEALQGEYPTAINWFLKSLTLIDSSNINIRKGIYEKLAQAYRHQKDFVSADKYGLKAKAISDEIYSADNAKRMAELEANFAFEEKRYRIQQAQMKKDQQRFWTWMISLSVCFLLMMVGMYYYFYWSGKKAMAREDLRIKENEKILKAQQKLLDENKGMVELFQKWMESKDQK